MTDMHPTVTVDNPFLGPVDIDEMLAPVIAELWQAGIGTTSCCQDKGAAPDEVLTHFPHLAARNELDAGRAYINFEDAHETSAFLDAVGRSGPRDAFYVRMLNWVAPGAWTMTIQFEDHGQEADEEGGSTPSRFRPTVVQVAFPHSDIPEIVERLKRHNRNEVWPLGPVDWSTVEIEDPDGDA